MTRSSSRVRQPLSRVNLTGFAMPTSRKNGKHLTMYSKKKVWAHLLKLALPKFLLLPKKSELPKILGGLQPPCPPGPYAYERVKDSPPLHTSGMFQVGLPCYLGLNSGRSVLINVNKPRKHFSRNIHGAHLFPQSFRKPEHTIEHFQTFCKHKQASTHLILRAIRAKAKFCEHFQIGEDHSIPLNLPSRPWARETKTHLSVVLVSSRTPFRSTSRRIENLSILLLFYPDKRPNRPNFELYR